MSHRERCFENWLKNTRGRKIREIACNVDNACKACKGTGGKASNPCKSCDGSGQVRPKPNK